MRSRDITGVTGVPELTLCYNRNKRCAREEEDRLVVEPDLRKEGGPSRERTPQRRLFLPSSDSAGSLEEEERVEGPSQNKGKGRAPASEEVRGWSQGSYATSVTRRGFLASGAR